MPISIYFPIARFTGKKRCSFSFVEPPTWQLFVPDQFPMMVMTRQEGGGGGVWVGEGDEVVVVTENVYGRMSAVE